MRRRFEPGGVQVPIVEVVRDYVELAPSSRVDYFLGLCPVHNDRSPSFVVWPTSGRWRCYTCNTGGDVVSFLMFAEGISYAEAQAKLRGRVADLGLVDALSGVLGVAEVTDALWTPRVPRQRLSWGEVRDRLAMEAWWRG